MDSEKENLILSYVTYTFLLALMLVVSYAIYAKMNNSRQVYVPQTYYIPEVKVLTSAEVQAERVNLSPLAEKPSSIVESKNSETVFESATKDEIKKVVSAQNEVTYKSSAPTYLVEIENKEVSKTSEERSEDGYTDSVYIASDSSVQGSVVKTDQEQTKEDIPLSLNGSVLKLNKDTGLITLSLENSAGISNIETQQNTKITLNGKAIKLTDLNVADKIRVEGFGPSNNHVTISESIIVTGFYQLFP